VEGEILSWTFFLCSSGDS